MKQNYLKKEFDTAVAARAINLMLFESIKSVLRSDQPEMEYENWRRFISLMIIEGLGDKP